MKKLRALKTTLVLALVAVTVCGVATWQSGRVNAVDVASELFVNASGVTVTRDAEAPATFTDYKGNTIDRDFDLGMKGVLLSSDRLKSSVQLSPTFTGDFSMTFRAYSDVSFGSNDPNEFNKYNYVMTPYADLREISFIFEDESGKKFTVAIAAGEKYNVITPAARVIVGSSAFGYHYLNDATLANETPDKNAAGYFTRIGGTTFCNVARTGGKQVSDKSHPLTFGYDADEMEIYVIHYGSTVEKVERRLVADLDNGDMGLNCLDSFGNYKVTVEFTDISSGKDANVIVYDVNGQSLAGETFTDNVGPVTSVKKQFNAVKGQKYYLPAPTAFDLLEGKIAFRGQVAVNGGDCTVYAPDGTVASTWSEGCYFIPETEGDYTVTYTAVDGKGNLGVAKSFTVKAFNSLPDWDFEVVGGTYKSLEEGSAVYGKGSVINLYPVKALGSIMANGEGFAQVTLLKDGAVYGGIQNLALISAQELALEDAGEYTLIYNVKGYPELMKKQYSFTVSDSAPVFSFATPLPSLIESGKEISIPRATATLGEQKTLASASLYAPNGSLVQINSNKALIDQIGVYKVTYVARLNGASYSYTAYFNAAYSTKNAFVGNGDTVIAERGDSGDLFGKKIEGIKIVYSEADRFATYSKTIDLSKLSSNEPFIKVMVLPKKVGVLDFWQYTVRLTDVNDPKNYVEILVFKGSWGNAYSYVKAGAKSANQKPGGWEMGKFLTSYNAGTPILYSFTGESPTGTEQISLFYDYADKSVIVANIKRPGYAYGNEVADLDGLDCFSENALFSGFSTGEVHVSISVQDMQTDAATILVTEVGGISLANEWIDDTTAPRIGVDTMGYSESNLPLGLVNVAYPVFDGSAFDAADGRLPVSVKVYKAYQTLNQQELAITDGKFLPTETGVYSIIYSAVDKSGNRATKEVKINVSDSLEAFKYTFNRALILEYRLGEYFQISSGVTIGGSGSARAEVMVIAPDGKILENANGKLIDQVGTYVVRIKFTDFLGREQVTSYSVSATISDKPIVYEVILPTAMVDGVEYVLPDFEASDYSTGSYMKPTKSIKVVYGNRETILGEDRKFTPNVTNHQDTIKILYRATNENGAYGEYEYEVKVLKVETDSGIDMSKYFALENMTQGEKTNSYIEFDAQADGASIHFVNPLIANNLPFEIYVPKAKNNFNSVTVTISDSVDKNAVISFNLVKNSASANYSYLEYAGERHEIAGNFFDLTSYGISASYNDTSKYIFDRNGNKNLVKVSTNVLGEAFEGFASGKVYISFKLNGVEGASAIRVLLLGNQNFSNVTSDRVLPQIQLTSFIPKTAERGKEFVVPAAIAADVLSAEVKLKVTVSKGSKDIIYEGDIDKDYIFIPNAYGRYTIKYSATAGGRTANASFFVTVKDREKPTLSLSGAVPTTGSVGKEIKLPTATVTDNYSEDMRVWIYITEPTGRMITLEEGVTTFTPQMPGKHRVSYYVHDEFANYVYEKYVITVQ